MVNKISIWHKIKVMVYVIIAYCMTIAVAMLYGHLQGLFLSYSMLTIAAVAALVFILFLGI